MMWLASGLKGYSIGATDGEIGNVVDLLIDDKSWLIRWLVVDTGIWLPGRQVLLPPVALGQPSRSMRRIPASLTRRQVENSPELQTDAPVSRQIEADIFGYYGWSPYWTETVALSAPVAVPPASVPPGAIPPASAQPVAVPPPEEILDVEAQRGDPHLHSAGYVRNTTIQGTDGQIGHVEDFLVDDETWAIRYLIIDTVNWWPGKKVLIAPNWVSEINWAQQRVCVDVTRQQIKDSPEYTPSEIPDRDDEAALYAHYGYPSYWQSPAAAGGDHKNRTRTHQPDGGIRETPTEASVRYFASHPEQINDRLRQLDAEWDIERLIETKAAGAILAGIALGAGVHRRWYLLPVFAAGALFLHSATGWISCAALGSAPIPKLRQNATP